MSSNPRMQRATLVERLNDFSREALSRASRFAKLRTNPQVDLLHWLFELLSASGSDLDALLSSERDLRAAFETALHEELDALPRGYDRVSSLAQNTDEALSYAWVSASTEFEVSKVRSGHVLYAIVRNDGVMRGLGSVGKVLRRYAPNLIFDRVRELSARGPEGPPPEAETATGNQGGEFEQKVGVGPNPSGDPLKKYCTDITESARNGLVDPVIGRDYEIRQLIDVLQRRRQNNPILVGEPGVGKTAVVEGLALSIANKRVPPVLQNVSLLALDLGALQAGASMKGEFESRLRSIIESVQKSSTPIILFIDEAHTLIGAGGAAGTGDAANLLKPALARGTLRTIAATTWAEYKRYFEKDAALTRRFQVVTVDEPTPEAAIQMLHGLRSVMEGHHKVEVLDSAIRAAVMLSTRYIPSRQLPDKAISLLDTAAARVAVNLHAEHPELLVLKRRVEGLQLEGQLLERRLLLGEVESTAVDALKADLSEAEQALQEASTRWQERADLANRISTLRGDLTMKDLEIEQRLQMQQELAAAEKDFTATCVEAKLVVEPYVNDEVVATVVSDWTGIPLGRMLKGENETLTQLGELLSARVIGQAAPHQELANRIRVGKAGLNDPTRPIGVFLFAGPSGVGKTETALALAELLYGGETNLIAINMSEFQEAHTVSTLKGAPPGYVGFGEGGRLTEAVRKKPYSVVLLDEIEKAHPDVHEIFFQVFDKGVMEDSEGRKINFRNTVIILTTNVGSVELFDLYAEGKLDYATAADAIAEPLRDTFPDALLGRMKLVPFFPLGLEAMESIVNRRLDDLRVRVETNFGISVHYTPAVRAWVSERAKPTVFGARLVNALVTDQVAPAIASLVLSMSPENAADVLVDITPEGALQAGWKQAASQ